MATDSPGACYSLKVVKVVRIQLEIANHSKIKLHNSKLMFLQDSFRSNHESTVWFLCIIIHDSEAQVWTSELFLSHNDLFASQEGELKQRDIKYLSSHRLSQDQDGVTVNPSSPATFLPLPVGEGRERQAEQRGLLGQWCCNSKKHVTTHLSKPRGHTTPPGNPRVNYGLRVTVIYLCKIIHCNKSTTGWELGEGHARSRTET